MIVYRITNTVNGKVYIGQTIQRLTQRINEHLCSLASNTHGNKHFQNAYNKYGKDSFKIEQIDSASSIEELNTKEVYWIKFYDSVDRGKGYNKTSGGEGFTVSNETRNTQSLLRKGKNVGKDNPMFGKKRPEVGERNKLLKTGTKHSEASKQLMSSKLKGRAISSTHRERISQALIGREFSEKHRDSMSKAQIGKTPWNKGVSGYTCKKKIVSKE